MTQASPSFDDIFAVMGAASVGSRAARVTVSDTPEVGDTATMFAIALNILLDDLALSAADLQRELGERKRMADRLRVLTESAREFSAATSDYEHLLQVVATRLGNTFGDVCAIMPISDDGEWLEAPGAVHHGAPELLAATSAAPSPDRQRVGEGVSGRVAATGTPVLEQLGSTSSLTLPLLCRGKVLGVANMVRSRPDDPFDEDDLQFAESIADHAALAMGNARSYAAERAARSSAEKATNALELSESRFVRLSESGIIGITIADVHGNLVEANDTYLKMIGYTREEFLRGDVRWADLTPPEFVHLDALALQHLRTTGVAPPWETETFRKDGTRVPMQVCVAMLEYPHCLAIIADLSERKQAQAGRDRAEAALHKSEEQLRQTQKMEAIGRLAGGVAHDFNNLLSVILSYCEIILADSKPADPLTVDVGEIRMAARRAAALTEQLLMFSRQQIFDPKVIDLNEVLTGMDTMLQRILGEDVTLVSLTPESAGRIKADPSNIEQVILNLVVNARDAMPTGGKLTLATANFVLDEDHAQSLAVKPGRYVMMTVSDTGTGMDRETQRHIFEPFFTTKETGKGTGLGLSTVFGIVQQSGGGVWVYSEPGRGTTFKVYLPRVDEEVDTPKALLVPATLRGSETVLLVEDEEQVRTIAIKVLRRQGYRVLAAQNAGEALLLCERHPEPIDLLLTDVVMPQMSGPELAKRLVATRPGMRVLCMSGYTDDNVIRHGVLDAGVAFIQKPITPATLARKVRDVLDAEPVAKN